ncbi:MAG: hypothetical protein AAGM22_00140 [Acidobacteriota bacterium]
MSDEPHNDDLDVTTVFATSEADLIPVIKSVLRGADIPFITDGESMMNLFPSDLLGAGLLRPRGEIRFKVARDHVEAARILLSEYHGADGGETAEGEAGEGEAPAGDA